RALLARIGSFVVSFAGLLAMGCGDDTKASGMAGSGTGVCLGTPVVTAKRVVRLSEYQLFNSYASLFGAGAAATITGGEDPPSIFEREFPPISGDIGVSEGLLGKYDRLAQSAMTYISENAAALTPCGAVPSDKACVQQYLL